jgi:hypothetical protein
MPREGTTAFLILVAACGGGRRIPETRAVVAGASEVEINRVIEEALQADVRSQPADSLYSSHAMVIADGRVRRLPPRFAGVAAGGEIAITSTQMEIRGGTAWGDVEYRWVSDRTYQARSARASFVLTPAQGRQGWWVVQAHSSTAK